MTNRTAASRYARALLEVSQDADDPARVERDVAAFARLMTDHPQLHSILTNPAVPPAQKRAVVTELGSRLGGLSPVATRLVGMLAERDRLALIEEILEVFRERWMEQRGVVRARVTTASPLSADRVHAISERLAATTGKQVELEATVDPEVIGGVVARLGSTVYDGSIARHLARLRQRFLEGA